MKEVIYRNADEIAREMREQEKMVGYVNEAIEAIKAEGVELTEAMLPYVLQSNYDYLLSEVERQIRKEYDESTRFRLFKKRLDVSPVLNAVTAILDTLKQRINSPYYGFNTEQVAFHNGKAVLLENALLAIEEKHSIFIVTDEQKKAWELAIKARDAINELEDYLQKHGDGNIHSCSNDAGTWFSKCMVLMRGSGMDYAGWRAELYPHCIPHVIK